MLDNLKKEVYEANMKLAKSGLVILTWGNVSGIDREKGLVVIKPSGLSYDEMTINDMVVVDLDGNVVEGDLKPSSDTLTHLMLYKAFLEIGGVVHTHSTFATAFAQAGMDIECLGTTHADTFYGKVLCSRKLSEEEISSDYEANTGSLIIEELSGKDYNKTPAILVHSHGPFVWGNTASKALENAIILEEVAKMAFITKMLNPNVSNVDNYLMDKHYFRKHGEHAYYGQGEK